MDPHRLFIADHQSLRAQAEVLKYLVEKAAPSLSIELVKFQTAVQKHFMAENIYIRILEADHRVPDRALMHQLRNDHAAVIFTLESLIIRLRKSGVNPEWRGRFDNLMNVFLPHLDLEESHLFTLGQKELTPEELTKISQHIQDGE